MVEVLRNPDRPGEVDEETEQTVSKEEEERYRKLQQENEQLQQLIAAREHKLKLLNQRLLEKNASNGGGATAAPQSNPISTPVVVSSAPVQTISTIPHAKKNRCALMILSFITAPL